MRKYLLLIAFALVACLTSCEDEPSFDATLLVGKWKSGTEYYRYDDTQRGVTWDEGDDVTEAEGQPFTWELDGNVLTVVHQMEMGGQIPKTYEVTTLNATTLAYKDDYYKNYTYTRVQ